MEAAVLVNILVIGETHAEAKKSTLETHGKRSPLYGAGFDAIFLPWRRVDDVDARAADWLASEVFTRMQYQPDGFLPIYWSTGRPVTGEDQDYLIKTLG